jgi:hypothetical protein
MRGPSWHAATALLFAFVAGWNAWYVRRFDQKTRRLGWSFTAFALSGLSAAVSYWALNEELRVAFAFAAFVAALFGFLLFIAHARSR